MMKVEAAAEEEQEVVVVVVPKSRVGRRGVLADDGEENLSEGYPQDSPP
jgi:hypothetical protein